MMKIKGILGMLWMLFPLFAFAQEKVVPIKYGALRSGTYESLGRE